MGDFNARTGLGRKPEESGEWRNHDLWANESGKRLINLVKANGLEFLDLPRGIPPFTRVSGLLRSTIDYILVSPQLRVDGGGRWVSTFNAGSDHSAVVATIQVQVQAEAKPGPVQEIPNFEKLRDGPEEEEGSEGTNVRKELIELRNRFADYVQEKLGDWAERCDILEFPTREDVDRMFGEWTAVMREAGTAVLGVKKVGGKKRKQNYGWWTKRLSKISKERRKIYERLTRGGPVKRRNWEKYIRVREEVRREIEAAKRGGWEFLMNQIVEARGKPSKKRMWGLIRRTVKKPLTQADPTQVIGDDGRLTASVDEALRQWRNHFSRVANPTDGDFDEEFREQVDRETEERRETMHFCDPLQVDADLCEAAIKDIPVGASPGANGVGNAAIKYGGGHRYTPMEKAPVGEEKEQADMRRRNFAAGIAAMCNLVGRAREIPRAWDEARQVPIPKSIATEDPTDRDNFRGVTLRDATGKLASKIFIHKYFDKKYEEMMCIEQGGFRRGRRCAHQLFALVDTVQRANTCRRPLYILFVDFRKAYPSVWRNGMFKKFVEGAGAGMGSFIEMMEKFANGGSTRIFLQGKESEPYTAEVGVQEGATESPKLFNIHINDLPQALREAGAEGVEYAAHFLAALFADDLAIASDSVQGLQVCLDALEVYCRKWRMTVSLGKTKVMRCGTAMGQPAPVTFRGQVVELVPYYKYLGVWVQENGKWDREFEKRMDTVRQAQRSVSPFLADRNVPIRLRAQVWTALVRSRIEYGCDIVVYNVKQKEAWERIQNRAAAIILGCNRHTASDAMRGELGWHRLDVRADRYRIRLLHEITQSDLLPLAKALWALEGGVDGGYARWPTHTIRKEFRRLDEDHDKIFGVVGSTHTEFKKSGKAGWKWAREVIEKRARRKWRDRLQEKVDECEGRGSVSQVSLYIQVKPMWGLPTYSQHTGEWVRVVARLRLGTLPVGAFEGKVKQGKGAVCPQCQVRGEEIEETIEHFAWKCEAGRNVQIRDRARRAIKTLIESSDEIRKKYEEYLRWRSVGEVEDDFRMLVSGTGVEHVYPKSFPERPKMIGGRTCEERRMLNRMNGRISSISQAMFGEMWENRNQALTKASEGVQEQRAPAPQASAAQATGEDFVPLPGNIGDSIRQASSGRNRSGAGATGSQVRRADRTRQRGSILLYFGREDPHVRGDVNDMPD